MGKVDELFRKLFLNKVEEVPNPTEDNENSPESFMDKGAEHIDPDVSQEASGGFCTASDMQESIFELCRLLSKSTSNKEFDCDAWIQQLKTYLSTSTGRLMYSAISNYIFDKKEEELATFETNIDAVLHNVERKMTENPEDEDLSKTFKAVLKFYDHSNLAIQQQKLVNKKRMDLEHEVEGILAPKVSDLTKEMTSQLVGLISIFTALSFIVFGGISSLENMVTSLQGTLEGQKSVLPILILGVAWAFFMINLLFGFMYFVIRITHLPKPVKEDAKNLVQRYPIVFFSNYVLLALLTLFGGMWFAKVTGVGKGIYKNLVDDSPDATFKGAIVIYAVAFILLGMLLLGLYLHKKKDKVQRENKTKK